MIPPWSTGSATSTGGGAGEGRADRHAALHREALAVERARAVALRDEGFIDDEALHHIVRDLDTEEARLAPAPQIRGIT